LRSLQSQAHSHHLNLLLAPARSKFDLFAGVSGGSINAAMLATGMKPELMAEVQKFMAPAVFGKGKRQATLELKGLSLRRAKYSADPLLILGEELFQGTTQLF
jgi:predicted acylesterase/phospholipase RssA